MPMCFTCSLPHTDPHTYTDTHTPLHNQKSVPGCREKREFIKLSHPRWAAEKKRGSEGGKGGEGDDERLRGRAKMEKKKTQR